MLKQAILPYICYKYSHRDIYAKCVDPDQTAPQEQSDLDLHTLLKVYNTSQMEQVDLLHSKLLSKFVVRIFFFQE